MPKAKETHSGEVQTNLKLPGKTGETPAEVPQKCEEGIAWWIALLAFAAGMVTMYLAGKIRWKVKASVFKESEALKVLYGHMSDDPKVEAMVRKLYAKKNGDKSVIIDKKELKALVEKYVQTDKRV
jgi:Na+-translocating ferredoxin:NAD+ oxidoreductase RnfD subunit